MASETATAKRLECPSCRLKAKRVSTATLSSLLSDEFAQRFKTDGHACCASEGEGCTSIKGDTGWRFCDSTDCNVVYFSEDDDTVFDKSQLKVAVGVKEAAGERPLCYCFGHSVGSIKEELRTKGSSGALENIRAKMKDPGCRCETENPSGSCCLGSVGKGIMVAQEELGMNVADTTTPPEKPSGNKGGKIATVGTLVSAIMASACCWLPLVLLAVGVSGAGIAATLEEYRPYFMVITFGFLGAAFYYTYRPKKAAAVGEHDCCATKPAAAEDCCPPATGGFNMMTMNKVMLWGVTVMAVAFLFFPSYVGAVIGGDGKTVTDNMNRAVFQVEGMTCEGCSAIVAEAIRTAPGVLAVEVNYKNGEAVVGAEICCPVPKDEILAALEQSGYKGAYLTSTEGTPVEPGLSPESSVVPHHEKDGVEAVSAGSESILQTVFKIDGMTCEGCATGVADSIRSVPGITGVQVDFESGQALVQNHACCQLAKDDVLAALKKAGFDGKVIVDRLQVPPSEIVENSEGTE